MKKAKEFNILLIDDKRDLALNISDILEEKGYDTEIAFNGSEAISIVKKKEFDLAIVDLKLPDIFGLDLIEKISLISPELEYIVLTGHGKIEDAVNAVSSKKILAFEFKPIDIPRLLKILQELIRRRKTEQHLKEVEEKYKTIVERSLVGIYITQNHLLKFCNGQFAKIFGYDSPEELIGESVNKLVKAEDWSLVDSEVKMRERGKKLSSRYEFRGVKKNGSEIFLEVLGNRIHYMGKPAIQGTLLDITKRRNAEENLRKLSSAVEQSPLSIMITDIKGNIDYVNPEFTRLTGYKSDEVIGLNPRILKSGNTTRKEYKKMWDIISSGGVWQGEFLNKRKDGKLYWERASIGSLKNSKDTVINYIGVKADVSREKEYEEELRNYRTNLELMVKERTEKLERLTESLRESEKSLLYLVEDVNRSKMELEKTNIQLNRSLKEVEEAKNRIDAILKSMKDGIIVTNLKNEIVLINRYAEFIFNIKSNEILGRNIDTVIKNKGVLIKIKNVMSDSLRDNTFEFSIKQKSSKKRITIEMRISVVWDTYGIVNGLVMVFRDVTHEREIDRMKTEFISTSAHELRTPLTTIRGYSELLMSRSDLTDEEKKKFLGYINDQSVRLAKIISDLLDISRIESGAGLKIDKKSSDINSLILESVEQYKEIYKDHNFVFKLSKKIGMTNFDPGLISQVLINLISNAVKYSPDGGDITISTRSSRGHLICSVKDEGIGMTPEQIGRIFDKFYRVDSSNTAVEGSGLGMSIVKNIIESHEGTIDVKSSPGNGTEVVFKLPKNDISHKKERDRGGYSETNTDS